MRRVGLLLRHIAKLKFRVRNRATIKDIPTKQFNVLLKEFLSLGWKKKYVYRGFDAWIDYGKVKIKKDGVRLTFEWDNWTEGSIEGPVDFIEQFADRRGLEAIREWRWAEYDQPQP